MFIILSGKLKIKYAAFLCGIAIITTMFMCACFASREIKLTDFPKYNEFPSNISKIEVTWKADTAMPIIFTIEDDLGIEIVLEALTENTFFVKSDREVFKGHYGYMVFFDADGKDTLVSLDMVLYSNRTYFDYKDEGFRNLIKEIGIEKGALRDDTITEEAPPEQPPKYNV